MLIEWGEGLWCGWTRGCGWGRWERARGGGVVVEWSSAQPGYSPGLLGEVGGADKDPHRWLVLACRDEAGRGRAHARSAVVGSAHPPARRLPQAMPSDASPRFAPPIRALSPTRRGALLALSAARLPSSLLGRSFVPSVGAGAVRWPAGFSRPRCKAVSLFRRVGRHRGPGESGWPC